MCHVPVRSRSRKYAKCTFHQSCVRPSMTGTHSQTTSSSLGCRSSRPGPLTSSSEGSWCPRSHLSALLFFSPPADPWSPGSWILDQQRSPTQVPCSMAHVPMPAHPHGRVLCAEVPPSDVPLFLSSQSSTTGPWLVRGHIPVSSPPCSSRPPLRDQVPWKVHPGRTVLDHLEQRRHKFP